MVELETRSGTYDYNPTHTKRRWPMMANIIGVAFVAACLYSAWRFNRTGR